MSTANDDRPEWDPVFLHTRREALVVLACWGLMLLWTVGLCSQMGYELKPEDAISPLGLPHWVLWGILVPWLAAGVFTFWFALIFMVDDDLGEDPDAPPAPAEPAEADDG